MAQFAYGKDVVMKKISILLATCFVWVGVNSPAWADSDKRVLKVMTRNVDAGTDLGWFFVVPDVVTATALTLNEVIESDVPGRAALLADEIGTAQPDLIALQEVTVWSVGSPGGAPVLVLDQLQLLLDALAQRHLHYAPVAVNNLISVAAPVNATQLVSFLDRDVVLARTDLKQSELALSHIEQGIYQAKFGFPLAGSVIAVPRGWISVDAKVRGKTVRVFNTHLESAFPGFPLSTAVQLAQVGELLNLVSTTALPVVLAGDFNSNAELGPDHTGAVETITGAGFLDSWRVFNAPGTGFTWPLFPEDFLPGPVAPFERIDLIFTRFVNVLGVQRTGLNAPWPSDHAGLVTTILLN